MIRGFHFKLGFLLNHCKQRHACGDPSVLIKNIYQNIEDTLYSKASVMLPRRRNAMTTQTLRRSSEPVSVLRQVLVSGPITARAASPRRTVTIFGRRTSGPCGGRKEGPCVDVEP